jgi:hypothetical protein
MPARCADRTITLCGVPEVYFISSAFLPADPSTASAAADFAQDDKLNYDDGLNHDDSLNYLRKAWDNSSEYHTFSCPCTTVESALSCASGTVHVTVVP